MRTGHCITSSAPGPTCQGVRMQAQAGCCIDHDSCTADGRDLAAQQHRSTLAAQASRTPPHHHRIRIDARTYLISYVDLLVEY